MRPFFPGIGKRPLWFFQTLENLAENFPSLGKIRRKFSPSTPLGAGKAWEKKFRAASAAAC
jgi:hypothetical protein